MHLALGSHSLSPNTHYIQFPLESSKHKHFPLLFFWWLCIFPDRANMVIKVLLVTLALLAQGYVNFRIYSNNSHSLCAIYMHAPIQMNPFFFFFLAFSLSFKLFKFPFRVHLVLLVLLVKMVAMVSLDLLALLVCVALMVAKVLLWV